MSNRGRLSLLAVAAAPVPALATLALVTATPIAAQQQIAKPRPAECYTPAKVSGTKTFMQGPLTWEAAQAGCAGGVAIGTTVYNLPSGNYNCVRCGLNIQLSDGTCLKRCSASYAWKAVTRVGGRPQCCKATGPVGPFPDPQKYKTK